jgi:hypothetical protein
LAARAGPIAGSHRWLGQIAPQAAAASDRSIRSICDLGAGRALHAKLRTRAYKYLR